MENFEIVKTKLYLTIFLSLTLSAIYAQKKSNPKNLKFATEILINETPDNIKNLVKSTADDSLYLLCYPNGDYFEEVFHWISADKKNTKLKRYFKKVGISNIDYRLSIVLITFKHKILYGSFDEDNILKPYLEKQVYLDEQHRIRFTADTLYGVYIPKDLEDCFRELNRIFDDTLRSEIIIMDEITFASRTHFGLGMWIRNNWQLWGGSRLSTYFQGLGVFHPDDISWIIIVSYHRYLSGKEIKLEEQIRATKTE